MRSIRTKVLVTPIVCLAFLSLNIAAHAQVIGQLNIPGCEVANIFPDQAGGDTGSVTFLCPIGTGAGGANAAGIATVTSARDFFSDVISPVALNGTLELPDPSTITLQLTSHPTWDPGVVRVPVELVLSGIVNKAGNQPASISFAETGMLGGGMLEQSHLSTQSETINMRMLGFLPPGPDAVLTVNIAIHGSITFRAIDSAAFIGAVPEPGSIAMLAGLGFSGCLFAVSRLRRRSNTAK